MSPTRKHATEGEEPEPLQAKRLQQRATPRLATDHQAVSPVPKPLARQKLVSLVVCLSSVPLVRTRTHILDSEGLCTGENPKVFWLFISDSGRGRLAS
jgi:hypothetical protein